MEERRQSYDNQPYAKSMLRINELAYGDYWPYSHSTIGDMQDLENAPLAAVQEFFDAYYAPNNAVLTLAGDFDPNASAGAGQAVLRRIPARQRPPTSPARSRRRPRSASRRWSIAGASCRLSTSPITSRRIASPITTPLDLLAIVLGDGESSRLYQKLVKARAAAGAPGRAPTPARPRPVLVLGDRAPRARTGAEARAGDLRELEKIAENGLSRRELEKAKNRMRSMFVFGLESNLSARLRARPSTRCTSATPSLLNAKLDSLSGGHQRRHQARGRAVLRAQPTAPCST